jgi:hypothetical protein
VGLCCWWTEQYEPAHRHWRRPLEAGRQFLEALLRAIARYKANPGPGLQQEAQQALVAYLGQIRDTAGWSTMLVLALDLQTGFPEIFTPVLPPPRP